MYYVVKLTDDKLLTSVEISWNNIPANIKSLSIYDMKDNVYNLENYDVWFFSDVADFRWGYKNPKHYCRMVAGFDKSSGCGKLITVFTEGTVTQEDIFLKDFELKYNKDSFKYVNQG